MLSIGAGLRPVPRSLASRAKSEAFVEMSELSPEQLVTLSSETPDKGKCKQRVVCNILEWISVWAVHCSSNRETREDPRSYCLPDHHHGSSFEI